MQRSRRSGREREAAMLPERGNPCRKPERGGGAPTGDASARRGRAAEACVHVPATAAASACWGSAGPGATRWGSGRERTCLRKKGSERFERYYSPVESAGSRHGVVIARRPRCRSNLVWLCYTSFLLEVLQSRSRLLCPYGARNDNAVLVGEAGGTSRRPGTQHSPDYRVSSTAALCSMIDGFNDAPL